MILVVTTSLCAAMFFAIAAFLQHRAAASGDSGIGLTNSPALLSRLVRTRSWALGWITNILGFVVQAVALHLGPLVVVQPLASTQLLFTLPLSAVDGGPVRPRARDWGCALLVCVGLALLIVSQGDVQSPGVAHPARLAITLIVAAFAVVVCAVAAGSVATRVGALFLAVGAGICYAVTAVALKLTIEDLVSGGLVGALTDWPVYILGVSTATGLVMGQSAFAAGPLPWVLAAMSVTNPFVGYIAGLVAFDTPWPRTTLAWVLTVIAAVLVVTGLVGIASSKVVRAWYGPIGAAAGADAAGTDDAGADDETGSRPKLPAAVGDQYTVDLPTVRRATADQRPTDIAERRSAG
ncbi:DMT family transporter [Gordonia jinhuaensis]